MTVAAIEPIAYFGLLIVYINFILSRFGLTGYDALLSCSIELSLR